MRPDDAAVNAANLGLPNAELLSQAILIFPGGTPLADIQNLRRCQPRHTVLFATVILVAPLLVSVAPVVSMRTEEEVGRVDAWRIVAVVANVQDRKSTRLNYSP